MKQIGSTYQYEIPGKRIQSGQLSAQEKAAVERAEALKHEVEQVQHDTLAAPATQRDGHTEHTLDRSTAKGWEKHVVRLDDEQRPTSLFSVSREGWEPETHLSSHLQKAEATGVVRREVAGALHSLGVELSVRAESRMAQGQGQWLMAAGHQVRDVAESVGHVAGPDELEISKTKGSHFEAVVFHNDGSISYGSDAPDPQTWLMRE